MPKLLALAFVLACLAAPALADAEAGRDKSGQCRTCHGADGIASLPNAPHLAGQPEAYLAAQLRAYRDGTRSDPNMDVVAQQLSDEDIADLAAYYAAIEISATVPENLR